MNSSAALLVAQEPDRRMLAGDQLYVDLGLSPASLPWHPARAGLGGHRGY
jgi:hypothetical protein